MKYDHTTRTLTLERRDCRTCQYGAGGPGEYTGSKTCPTCSGTGRGPRGGRNGCKDCWGGHQHDFDNPIPCPTCGGEYENAELESFCDYLPAGVIETIPVRLVRQDRRGTWNEAYLGHGTIFSVTDYGDRWRQDDDLVLEYVTARVYGDTSIQATKVLQRYERGDVTATLHDELVVVLHRDGYSVVAHTPEVSE